jgi:hypothetical protein
MELISKNTNALQLIFSQDELALFANCLNEVLHGFAVPEFESRIGTTRQRAQQLLDLLNGSYEQPPGQRAALNISSHDANAIAMAATVVISELGEEEFSTRVGHEVATAREYLNALGSHFGRIR